MDSTRQLSEELLKELMLASNAFELRDLLIEKFNFSRKQANDWVMSAGVCTNFTFNQKGEYKK